jgi:hypothetical protein
MHVRVTPYLPAFPVLTGEVIGLDVPLVLPGQAARTRKNAGPAMQPALAVRLQAPTGWASISTSVVQRAPEVVLSERAAFSECICPDAADIATQPNTSTGTRLPRPRRPARPSRPARPVRTSSSLRAHRVRSRRRPCSADEESGLATACSATTRPAIAGYRPRRRPTPRTACRSDHRPTMTNSRPSPKTRAKMRRTRQPRRDGGPQRCSRHTSRHLVVPEPRVDALGR